jgi:hypothetical protein
MRQEIEEGKKKRNGTKGRKWRKGIRAIEGRGWTQGELI